MTLLHLLKGLSPWLGQGTFNAIITTLTAALQGGRKVLQCRGWGSVLLPPSPLLGAHHDLINAH